MSECSTSDDAEVEKVKEIAEGIVTAAEGHNMLNTYAALVYCLGRCISAAKDPAELLCLTIPKLARAAKLGCVEIRRSGDLDELELEEILRDDHSQSTH